MAETCELMKENGQPDNRKEERKKLDLLDRDGIVDQMFRLIELIQAQKGSFTFALNGAWGTGKTFVLDMLKEKLEEYRAGEFYLVFRYNCWEYDFYEEPLYAITEAMMEEVDRENHVLSLEARNKIKALVCGIRETLLQLSLPQVSNIVNNFTEGKDVQKKEYHLAFKKTLSAVKKKLAELSENRTLVIIVDELDRCLPDYAIKILERLHHLFYGLPNCFVILGVDKKQLSHTVGRVFGMERNNTEEEQRQTEAYLKKFINFEFTLDPGTINNNFTNKFKEYFDMFNPVPEEELPAVNKFLSALFHGIDMRTQERLMDRIKTVHLFLDSELKARQDFMFLELMWLVFAEHYKAKDSMPFTIYGVEVECFEQELRGFTRYIKNEWSELLRKMATKPDSNRGLTVYFSHEAKWSTTFVGGIVPYLIIYLNKIYPHQRVVYRINNDIYGDYDGIVKEFQKVKDLLQIIK